MRLGDKVARITVVGGANIDIQGFPAAPLRLGDSNPGSVRSSAGGVGRNIAENLARLGHVVRFISAFGDDEASKRLLDGLAALGVDTTSSLVLPGRSASQYLCILEREGRLHVAISDMQLIESIRPEVLEERADALQSAELCVFDANLSAEALAAGIALCGAVPCLLDTVSAAKAVRAVSCAGSCFALKPNEAELEVLSGLTLRSDRDLDRAAELLHNRGTRELFVSLGERGLYFSDGTRRGVAEGAPARLRNVSGAGDAMTAALADGLAVRRPIQETAAFAAAAAAMTAESADAVCPDLSAEGVRRRAAAVRVHLRA